MKKLIALLLVLACAFALVACGGEPTPGPEPECEHVDADENGKCDKCGKDLGTNPPIVTDPFDAFVAVTKANAPTKITTLVNYLKGDDSLNGKYVSTIDGDKMVFEFDYARFATVEEEAASRIVKETGKVYYKDGLIAKAEGDEQAPGEWGTIAPSGLVAKFDLKKDNFDSFTLSEDGSKLSIVLSGANVAKTLGADFSAAGNVNVEVVVENGFLSGAKIVYTTANGASVTVNTSYTYNKIALDF